MHNLKEIRKDLDAFKKNLEKRSLDIDFDKLKNLDIKNRELIQKKETLEKEPDASGSSTEYQVIQPQEYDSGSSSGDDEDDF